jgi:hypothetical protein
VNDVLTTLIAVLGGITGFGGMLAVLWKTYNDRKAGIDSKEISSGELELAQDEQSWRHLVEVVNQLRTDRDYLLAKAERQDAALAEQAVDISSLRSLIADKDGKIMLLETDIVVLLEHINSGKQPPPPPLRGYRGKETHE